MGARDTERGCPACGEPIGARATYCMHCGADLPDRAPDPEDADDGDDSFLSRLRSWSGDESGGEVTIERERERASTESSDTPGRGRDVATDSRESRGFGSETDSTRSDRDAHRGPGERERATGDGTGTDRGGGEELFDGAFDSSLKAAGATLAAAGFVLLYATSISLPGTIAALVAWAAVSAAFLTRDSVLDAVPRLVVGFVLFMLFVPTGFSFGVGLSPIGLLSAGIVLFIPALFVAWGLRHK